jgi:hypothetical protein
MMNCNTTNLGTYHTFADLSPSDICKSRILHQIVVVCDVSNLLYSNDKYFDRRSRL